jgi:hypothetical protein
MAARRTPKEGCLEVEGFVHIMAIMEALEFADQAACEAWEAASGKSPAARFRAPPAGRQGGAVGPVRGADGMADAVTDRDKVKLLSIPYKTPPLKRGDRAACLYRDCTAVIPDRSSAPIPWPCCHALDSRGRVRVAGGRKVGPRRPARVGCRRDALVGRQPDGGVGLAEGAGRETDGE